MNERTAVASALEFELVEVMYKYGSLICIIINSEFFLFLSIGLKYLKD
jgi:hypothetical protein